MAGRKTSHMIQAIHLREIEGKSIPEAAKLAGISVSNLYKYFAKLNEKKDEKVVDKVES